MNDGVYNEDGNGRDGTEIDVYESLCGGDLLPNAVSSNLHYDGYNDAHEAMGDVKVLLKNNPYEEYNTYGVEWNENESPIDTGQILADNMAVQLCITRPDGEQSGWYSMIKIDAEDKYYYTLQAWDTAVAGIATVVVRWHDTTIAEENRPEYPSDEASFIVDNGKIAQPLNISSENYNEIVLQFITPLSAQAFRKYNANALPDTVIYSADGAKTAPALYFNFTHDVVDIVPSVLNKGSSYDRVTNSRDGILLVNKMGDVFTEAFITTIGKIYIRTFIGSAGEFKDIFEEYQIKNVEQQRSINGLINLIVEKVNYTDIIDNLESDEFGKVLSARQGKVLNEAITAEKTARTGADEKLQESINELDKRTLVYFTADDDGNVYANQVGGE